MASAVPAWPPARNRTVPFETKNSPNSEAERTSRSGDNVRSRSAGEWSLLSTGTVTRSPTRTTELSGTTTGDCTVEGGSFGITSTFAVAEACPLLTV